MRRRTWAVTGAVVLVAGTAISGVVAMSGGGHAIAATQEPPINTGTVEQGTLSDAISQYGILTYRARSDGSPYAVFNQARGTYTELPGVGKRVGCGEVPLSGGRQAGAAAVRHDAGVPLAVGGR